MSRAGTYAKRSDIRFTPSRQDIALFRLLRDRKRPMSRGELRSALGAHMSTLDHSLAWWHSKGLLVRAFYDKQSWYFWEPRTEAKALVDALLAAERIESKTGNRGRLALARFLRALAGYLDRN